MVPKPPDPLITSPPQPPSAPTPTLDAAAAPAGVDVASAEFGVEVRESDEVDEVAPTPPPTPPTAGDVEGWSVWGERIGAGIVAVGVMVVALSMVVAVPLSAFEVRRGSDGGEQRPNSGRSAYHLVVDINRDSWQRLSLVPGIGEKTAITIVEWRDRLGGFRSVDDLLRISGIGPRKLDRWRPYLTLSTRPTPPPTATLAD